jgi:hypothetical protein
MSHVCHIYVTHTYTHTYIYNIYIYKSHVKPNAFEDTMPPIHTTMACRIQPYLGWSRGARKKTRHGRHGQAADVSEDGRWGKNRLNMNNMMNNYILYIVYIYRIYIYMLYIYIWYIYICIHMVSWYFVWIFHHKPRQWWLCRISHQKYALLSMVCYLFICLFVYLFLFIYLFTYNYQRCGCVCECASHEWRNSTIPTYKII